MPGWWVGKLHSYVLSQNDEWSEHDADDATLVAKAVDVEPEKLTLGALNKRVYENKHVGYPTAIAE